MIIEEIPIFSYICNELIHEIQSLFLMRAISSCVGRVLFWNILMMWDWKKEEKKSREHTAIVLAVMNASRDSGDQRVWPLIYRQDGQDTETHLYTLPGLSSPSLQGHTTIFTLFSEYN